MIYTIYIYNWIEEIFQVSSSFTVIPYNTKYLNTETELAHVWETCPSDVAANDQRISLNNTSFGGCDKGDVGDCNNINNNNDIEVNYAHNEQQTTQELRIFPGT